MPSSASGYSDAMRLHCSLVSVFAPALLFACHPKDATPRDTAAPVVFEDPDGQAVTVDAGGQVHFRSAGGAVADERTLRVAFGFVSHPDDTVNYDPWNLYAPDMADAVPSGLSFADTVTAEWDGSAYLLTLDNGETARLELDDTGPGVRFTVTQSDGAEWAPYVRVRLPVEDTESFYGLGEWFDGSEHRGHVHPMQIEIDPTLESSYNEAHVPVPLLVSSVGWGVLADSYMPGTFDVAATDPDTVDVIFDQADGFSFDLYFPGTPRDTVARYHVRTGMPEVPPDWAFAPLQWHDDDITADILLQDAADIRRLGVPGGCVWIDNPWQTTYNSMVPDPARFPDWESTIGTLQAKGFRMLAWTTPYLSSDDPEYADYAGLFVDLPIDLHPDQFGDMLDLTNPDAMEKWQGRVTAAQALGIEGWKLDYGEDVQVGVGVAKLDYPFANGESGDTMHHRYAQYFHRAYQEPSGNTSFLLGRGGVLGGQVYTDTIWPGDIDSDFRHFGDDGHVGGLPSAIRAGTGLAASGYPFFASDTGGYRHDRPTSEVMIRWTEYSALLPIMQYGGSGLNHNPWDYTAYGDSVFTEQTLTDFLRYAVLHIRLFPYFRMLADRAGTTGEPFLLAEGFAYPGLDSDTDFLVGDDVFVAPVEESNVTGREVTLPPGGWVHWWTGERYEGTVTVPAPLGEGPLFQREGSAIPLLRRTVVTLAPTDGTVDSWADDPGRLNARIVPGAGAGFTLATGEAVTADADVVLTDGTLYTGWDVEIWHPDATAITVDGVSLPAGTEGCTDCWIAEDPWVRVVVDGGTIAVE
jgi:alpha-D-xyloside xylohydrolase